MRLLYGISYHIKLNSTTYIICLSSLSLAITRTVSKNKVHTPFLVFRYLCHSNKRGLKNVIKFRSRCC